MTCAVCGVVASGEKVMDGTVELLPRGWTVYVTSGKRRHRCPDCQGAFDFEG